MIPFTRFDPPPGALNLGERDVHLWRACLRSGPPASSLLSAAELARASRFHFERDRFAFIASRSLRRRILSRYLVVPPGLLEFAVNEFGKPRLAHPNTPLRFNVSQAGDLLLIGIAYGREVGVDLEIVRENVSFDDIARRHFPPEEAASLQLLPPDKKAEAFFEMWTRLEARLKAIGVESPDSSTRPSVDSWSTRSLVPEVGYRAAITVEAPLGDLSCWSFDQPKLAG